MTRHHPLRAGFSLIEAAIVLGIVGIVIGGIWVAAEMVQKQKRIGDIMESVSMAREAARSIYKSVKDSDFTVDLSAVMARKPLAGGAVYSVDDGCYRKGNILLCFSLDAWSSTDKARYFYTEIYLNVNGDWSAILPDKPLCMALANRFLALDLGRAPITSNMWRSVLWYNADSGAVVAGWNTGSSKPTMDQISAYCTTANDLIIFWAL